ncbi:MAG: DUF4363 family protein [Clostridiales bacterium]|jgi:hypothetical protein|nr:DUF4363 family protein [Clostridiales bacterium]
MKKRVIISIALLIIAFSTCAVSFVLISNEIGRLRGALYDAIFTAENYGMSESLTDTVMCEWNDVKRTFDIFLDENDVHDIERIIPSIGDSLRGNDIKRYCELCSECIHYLGVLLDNIKLRIENVL